MSLSSGVTDPARPGLSAHPDDLADAVGACDFPLVVWSTSDALIRMANDHAADLFGIPLNDLVGRSLQGLLGPGRTVSEVASMLAGGELSAVTAVRRLANVDVSVRVWTRAIQLADMRGGISLFMPLEEVGRLGRDPTSPLRDLYPAVVGFVTRDWKVTAISAEIRDLAGREPDQVVGHSLLEFVHPNDISKLTEPGGGPPETPESRCWIRLHDRASGWVDGCWLLSPAQKSTFAFAIITRPRSTSLDRRIAELELALRRIAAEVRAAGMLSNITVFPSTSAPHEMPELTSRQWEILGLLVQGKRVPTIAGELYVSQSTVRNHLSAIFKKFGVHSQAELLEVLRR